MTSSALDDFVAVLGEGGVRSRVGARRRGRDWMRILDLANGHLLGPALYQQVVSDPSGDGVPGDVLAYLAELYTLNRRRNDKLRRQCEEIVAAFNAAGIVPVLLKGGISLFEKAGDGSRMMRDLDMLVGETEGRRAAQILDGLGYYVLNAYPNGHHAIAEFARAGEIATVDLHVELIDPSYVLPAAQVITWSVDLAAADGHVRAPAPTDRALHNILHAQIHHLGNFYRADLNLGHLYDLLTLVRQHGADIDWEEVEQRMRTHHVLVPLHVYLLAANRLMGMPWPLASRPGVSARLQVRMAIRLLTRPKLAAVMTPVGNLRRAFAWHRMRALYGPGHALICARIRHAWQFIEKKSAIEAIAKIFRMQ